MANKPQLEKYGRFGQMTEAYRRSRRRLRREYVPEMAAWLLTMGMRQEKIARGLAGKAVQGSFPGLAASLRYCRQAIQTCEWLIHTLLEPFDAHDWDQATFSVAEHFGITQSSPVMDSPDVETLVLDQARESEYADDEG